MFKKWLGILWYWYVLLTARVLCMFAFRLGAYGKKNIPSKGGFLLLCNHQSYLDPVICSAAINRACCFAARDTLFKSFVGKLMTSLNAIPIKRGQADIKAMRMFIDKLKEGYALILFPEATRSTDGKISDIKPGFGLLSRRSKTPVVPVVIDGAFECWPKGQKMFSFGKIVISYGEPIPPEKIKELGDVEFSKMLTEKLRQMQTELRIKIGKKPYEYLNS